MLIINTSAARTLARLARTNNAKVVYARQDSTTQPTSHNRRQRQQTAASISYCAEVSVSGLPLRAALLALSRALMSPPSSVAR